MTSSLRILTLPLLLLLLHLISHVHGHGMMCFPRQRAAYKSSICGDMTLPGIPDSEIVIDYCAHCLNGGTVSNVKKHLPSFGFKTYEPIKDFAGTADRAGICGDPKGNNDHMIGGVFMPYSTVPIVATWKKGGIVDMTAELDTNHNGYFEFRVCNMDTCPTNDVSKKCFDEGHCQLLQRVPHSDCQDPNVNTHYECGPIDADYPSRWYVPCRKTAHVGKHIVGGDTGTMRYKLPDGFECKHCVLQWYWATANSCAPRGFMNYFKNYSNPFGTTCPSDGGGLGAHRPGMHECGGGTVPEEFWSCADISITKDGESAGPIKAVGGGRSGGSGGSGSGGSGGSTGGSGSGGESTGGTKKKKGEESGKRKGEERGSAAKSGKCTALNEICSGDKPCCGCSNLCVYTESASNYICREVWDLWHDVNDKKRNGTCASTSP